ADGEAEERWTDRPIPELGGLRIGFDQGAVTVTSPDGLRATSDEDLAHQLESRADEAESRADEAESRADEAESRADEAESRADEAESRAELLAERLRELGVDPEDPPSC
ncbi:MAG: alanine-zipper protein, partial [Acidimicrobiales bacterium]